MSPLTTTLVLVLSLQGITCPAIPGQEGGPPPAKEHHEGETHKDNNNDDDLGLEYGRYLQEVVSALEQDKSFAAKLENASAEAIKSGSIASHLDLVDHSVRSRLDELKRLELDRLHKLTKKEHALNHHVDVGNPESFEVADLHRLIVKATADLEALDQKRRQEFKEYEMRKELEFRSELAHAPNDSVRLNLIQEKQEQDKKRGDHARVHEPGHRAQLEEVWSKNDHLDKSAFDPKTFFALHDLNSDGYLDSQEVESVLQNEVSKLRDVIDPVEQREELHRMREHVYRESDSDADGLISKREFLALAAKSDFQVDNSWTDDEVLKNKIFQEKELRDYYERLHAAAAQSNGNNPNNYYYYEHAPPPLGYYDPRTGHVIQGQAYPQYNQGSGQPPVMLHQPGAQQYQYNQGVPQGQPQYQGVPQGQPQYQGYPNQQQPGMMYPSNPNVVQQQQQQHHQQQQQQQFYQQQPQPHQQPQQKTESFPPTAAPVKSSSSLH